MALELVTAITNTAGHGGPTGCVVRGRRGSPAPPAAPLLRFQSHQRWLGPWAADRADEMKV